ncbi:MAG: InlB B-repeat-containing protein, partial [Oscillibacter sp.]|nr:InlB B-repeat-containing protein [Oscillibacter sp.]
LENDNARTFAGWSLEKGVTEYNDGKGHIADVIDWESFTMPEAALSVYPVWVENQLNVRLDLGAYDEHNTRWWYDATKYDKATPAHMDATQGRHFWEKSGAFVEMDYMKAATRPGYTLDGWFTQSGLLWDADWPLDPEYCDRDADGNTILLEDTEYRNFYYTLTLTARWTPEPVKVEIFYDLNGGAGDIVDEATYVVNDLLTVSALTPTPPENQLFVGWLDKAGNLYQPGDKTIFASEDWIIVRDGENVLLLTAQYEDIPEPEDVTITFNTGGGSMTPSIVGKPGAAVTAPENPTRIGYTFAGWSPDLPETIPDADLTVSAKWTPNRYTITFNAGRGSAVSDMSYDFGAAVRPPADPTLTGYTFAGWDSAFPETMPAQNLSFKAMWTVNSYTITFDADGGESVAPITAIYGARVTAPAEPVRDGYVFDGWSREIPSTMPAENLTIKARWLVKPSTPDAPPAQAVSPTSVEVNPALTAQEYSIDGGKTWVTPTSDALTFDGLTPATEYAVITRIAETPTSVASEASAETKVTTPKENVNAPSAPPAKAVSPTSVEVNPAIPAQEYSIDGGKTWVTPTGDTLTFDNLTPATEYAVITRIAATPSANASDASAETKVTTPKENPGAPSAPPAKAVSPTSIEVNPAVTTQEYSIDGGKTWVTPTGDTLTFDGLTPATEYAVITRIAATPTANASEASAETKVTTPKENVNAP